MSFWVAGAIVVGSVVSAVGQSKASKTVAGGQKDAAATLSAAAAQARREIIPRFEQARIAQREGFGDALNLLGQTPEQVTRPFQQGNVLAQQQVGRGLGQVQNALLGRPVDLQGFQARNVTTPPSLFPPELAQRRQPQQPIQQPRPPVVGDPLNGGFRLPSPAPNVNVNRF